MNSDSDPMLQHLYRQASAKHAEECAAGAAQYATDVARLMPDATFSQEDFITHCIGAEKIEQHHVRDAESLQGPSRIHMTKRPVMSDAEVAGIVAEARAQMDEGVRASIQYADRRNLAVVHVPQLPMATEKLSRRLADTLLPMLADRYGLEAAALRIFDAIVIRYDAADGAEVRLPVHRDTSLISLNIALSSPGVDFEGGGYAPLLVRTTAQGARLLMATFIISQEP